MDKFSYALGLGIGQNLLGMGASGISIEDFSQAIKDIFEKNDLAISHQEAQTIVQARFAEMQEKIAADTQAAEKVFFDENKNKEGVKKHE